MSNKPDDLETIPELELTGGVRGKYYDRYVQGTTWRLELTEPFLASLTSLPDTVAVGTAVASLLEQIERQPQAAPLVPGTRVQELKTEAVSVSGQRIPALRLLYVLGHSNDTVRVLMVQPADHPLRIPENIAAQLQPVLNKPPHSKP